MRVDRWPAASMGNDTGAPWSFGILDQQLVPPAESRSLPPTEILE